MFISPEVRIETLWVAVRRQMERLSELRVVEAPTGVQRAQAGCEERHLMLISWVRLLDRMATRVSDATVLSDIEQIRGLARRQDAEAFLPIHPGDLNPDFGRRVVGYNRLVDDAVDARGVAGGWMDISDSRAVAQRYGYGRYFRFTGVSGYCWFGVNHELWAERGDTPLWIRVGNPAIVRMDAVSRDLKVRVHNEWIPIHLKTGVEYPDVLDDAVSQLKAIAAIVQAQLAT